MKPHVYALVKLSEASGSSLGYGITRTKSKAKLVPPEFISKEDDGNHSAPQGILAVPGLSSTKIM